MRVVDPVLSRIEPNGRARGLVLILHGGQESSTEPVLRRHGSWSRMALLQYTLAVRLRGRGVAVWLLRNRVRGWNERPDRDPAPVHDACFALAVVRSTRPGLPVVLVGHSMGGRTACVVAADHAVVGVCALAPWLPPGSPVGPLAGKVLVVAHGSADQHTSPEASRAFVTRCRSAGTLATYIEVSGGGHALLRRLRSWNRVVAETCTTVLRLDEAGR